MPVPLPLPPEVIVIQEFVFSADHPQPALAVTLMVPEPPEP